MRSEGNPLDLNNLPEEYARDGKQNLEENSSNKTEASDATRCRKKRSGGKDECGKVYECRFCSLKFCKSQALGGHMNRHRQERETETLNRARQLVFSNDNNLAAQGGPHLGMREMNIGGAQGMPGNFPQTIDPSIPYRSTYPTRLFPSSSPTIISPIQPPAPPAPPQAYLYNPSSSRLMSFPSSHYPPHSMNDYFVGHVLPPNNHHRQHNTNYNCIGEAGGSSGGSGESTQEDGVNWSRSYGSGRTQCFDHSSVSRFHDGL